MIPQSFIQDLLARADIVDVVERYVPLKKAGANYQACCPFHNEKSPSFTVSPTKQFYHCFGCGAHGSAIGFLMEYAGLSYPDAIRDLAAKLGLAVPEERSAPDPARQEKSASLVEVMARAARFYREQLKQSPRAIEYLKGRGLTGEVAARFGIGYAPDDWSSLKQVFPRYDVPELLEAGLVIENDSGRRYDRFRDRIMFPILDGKGNVVGFGGRILDKGEPKYLNSPETPLFEKGRELYGLPQAQRTIRSEGTVIVVEGYMDVVALAQFGVGNAVATLGTATTPNHVHKLLRLAERVVFCFDGDAAGRKAAWRALEASLEQLPDGKSAAFLFLPPEHDPDSFVRAFGPDAYAEQAAKALPLTDFLLQELKSRVDLSTGEGRSRLIFDAKPLISRLQAPMLRLQLTRSLAGAARMEAREVEQLCGLKPLASAARPPAQAVRGGARRSPPPKVRRLLAVVLNKPAWSARLPVEVIQAGGLEGEALKALADAVDHGELPTGGLGLVLEHFRGSPFHGLIDELSSELAAEHPDEGVLEAEFNDLVDSLRFDQIRQEIEVLNAKARSSGLDGAEKHRLAELLAQKHGLKSPVKPGRL
ncbi:MAG: DNA primase [Rhodocyclaceae bacterium]|nr:DNA primase [Rhodocyclaceae bacterium]